MAISMSGATIDSSMRDSLNSTNVEAISGGESANTSGGIFGFGAQISGAALAGVTASFAQNVSSKIENYKSEVDNAVNELTALPTDEAFKGAGISGAIENFVESVKAVANSYTQALSEAEKQIINSVGKAYEQQDTDLSGQLGSDAGNMESNKISV